LRGEGAAGKSSAVITRRPGPAYPLTAEQEHLGFSHQADPRMSITSTIPHCLSVERGVELVPRWSVPSNEIVRRHENLRTSLPEADGRPQGLVAPTFRFHWNVSTFLEFPARKPARSLQTLITANHMPAL